MGEVVSNRSLAVAKASKGDEFYTCLSDIESELVNYTREFAGRTVYCNCDDPRSSQFVAYFLQHFTELGLERLIASCYVDQTANLFTVEESEPALLLDYDGRGEPTIQTLSGDGDFRCDECVNLLKQADVVVTNPPFSLFREYMTQLVKHKKDFLIIGNINAVGYQNVFPHIQHRTMWCGLNSMMSFNTPQGKRKNIGCSCWFTNLGEPYCPPSITLTSLYNPNRYPPYDNYDAIEVSRTCDIPADYTGVMGVPGNFILSWTPQQFEIVGLAVAGDWAIPPSKTYPAAIRVTPDGRRTHVCDVNSRANGPIIKVREPPVGHTYFEMNDGYYIAKMKRILIRRVNSRFA